MIYILNKRRKIERIKSEYMDAEILDVTSSSKDKDTKLLSPFYPHGNIPIPFSPGYTACCVEGIWKGLKVFENNGIDFSSFENDTMSDLKRTVRKYGKPRGHQKGVNSTELLNYFEARMKIYLPTYRWVIENVPAVKEIIQSIKKTSKEKDIVLLDYNTNVDFRDTSKPLSHAGLIKLYIEGNYPREDMEYLPLTQEEILKKRTQKKKKSKTKQKASNSKQLTLF